MRTDNYPMTIFASGPVMAISWYPTSLGGLILLYLLMLGVSWWITGMISRERDHTTLVFRGMVSVLVCFIIGVFHRSVTDWISQGPMARALETKAEKEGRLQENMKLWVAPAAFDSCWHPAPPDPKKVVQMTAEERAALQANKVTPEILVESAIRALAWMALEHRQPSQFGRNAFPHAERGTMVLNEFKGPQAQAMYDYVRMMNPRSERDARPYLADAIAYCAENPAPGAAGTKPATKPDAVSYPFVETSRKTAHGRMFLIRTSPNATRMIEAASEEEALKIVRQPPQSVQDLAR